MAVALIVSLVENMLPPLMPILPYAKLGLSNVVLLAVLMLFGIPEGYLILVLKCVIIAVFSGNFSILLWSLPAGLLAFSTMVLLKNLKIFSITGMSVAGGIVHNVVQILVASYIIGKSVFIYLPYMMLAGGLAGLFTGICCHFLVVAINKKTI
ncbi:MAG TPA: Gx transporter family protein [Clostridia bacterium]|nr:Gx transporter family protein [Clostridia bacterium]